MQGSDPKCKNQKSAEAIWKNYSDVANYNNNALTYTVYKMLLRELQTN